MVTGETKMALSRAGSSMRVRWPAMGAAQVLVGCHPEKRYAGVAGREMRHGDGDVELVWLRRGSSSGSQTRSS